MIDFEYIDYEKCPSCGAEPGYRCTDTRNGRWKGRVLRSEHSARKRRDHWPWPTL